MNNHMLRAFTLLVVGVAAASVGLLPTDGVREAAGLLAVLSVLSIAVGSRAVRIPGTGLTVTAGDVFVFAALGGEAPLGAPLVALAGTLGAEILGKPRRSLLRAAFNLAVVPGAASAAAWLRVLCTHPAGTPGLDPREAVLLGALLYLATNLLLVAAAVALEGRRGVLATLRATGPWTLISVLASAVVALGLDSLAHPLGAAAPLLGLALVPLITVYVRDEAREPASAPSTPALRVATTLSR